LRVRSQRWQEFVFSQGGKTTLLSVWQSEARPSVIRAKVGRFFSRDSREAASWEASLARDGQLWVAYDGDGTSYRPYTHPGTRHVWTNDFFLGEVTTLDIGLVKAAFARDRATSGSGWSWSLTLSDDPN
jgi:hypothetical protein